MKNFITFFIQIICLITIAIAIDNPLKAVKGDCVNSRCSPSGWDFEFQGNRQMSQQNGVTMYGGYGICEVTSCTMEKTFSGFDSSISYNTIKYTIHGFESKNMFKVQVLENGRMLSLKNPKLGEQDFRIGFHQGGQDTITLNFSAVNVNVKGNAYFGVSNISFCQCERPNEANIYCKCDKVLNTDIGYNRVVTTQSTSSGNIVNTHTHTHTNTYDHAHAYTNTHANVHTNTHTDTNTYAHINTHADTNNNAHADTHAHTNTHAVTNNYPHTNTHADTNSHAHTNNHAHTNTHAVINNDPHTHTYTQQHHLIQGSQNQPITSDTYFNVYTHQNENINCVILFDEENYKGHSVRLCDRIHSFEEIYNTTITKFQSLYVPEHLKDANIIVNLFDQKNFAGQQWDFHTSTPSLVLSATSTSFLSMKLHQHTQRKANFKQLRSRVGQAVLK